MDETTGGVPAGPGPADDDWAAFPPAEAADAAGTGAAGDPWATFDRWSRNLLWFSIGLALLVAVIVFAAAGGAPGGAVLAAVVTLAADLAVYAILIRGLGDGAPWARPATVGVLWVMVGTGLLGALLDLTARTLTIPLGAILALWVLSKRPAGVALPPLATGARRTVVALVTVSLLVSLPSSFRAVLSRPPAIGVADWEDLELGISTNCRDPERITPGDDRLVVRVLWRWTREDLVPGGQDAVRLAWADLTPIRPVVADVIAPAGVVLDPDGLAFADGPDADTPPETRDVGLFEGDGGPALVFGIDGGSEAVHQGAIVVPFTVPNDAEPQSADLVATWAHDDHWTKPVSVDCEIPFPSAAP